MINVADVLISRGYKSLVDFEAYEIVVDGQVTVALNWISRDKPKPSAAELDAMTKDYPAYVAQKQKDDDRAARIAKFAASVIDAQDAGHTDALTVLTVALDAVKVAVK